MTEQNNKDSRGHQLLNSFNLNHIMDIKPGSSSLVSPDQVDSENAKALEEVGVLLSDSQRSGTFILQDFHTVCASSNTDGLEILPISDALNQYDWLREKYYWKAVPEDKNEFTLKFARQPEPQGFFLRVEKGAKVEFPYQTALYMANADITQAVHNVLILEEDSSLNLITGCVSNHVVQSGAHFAVSEQYIGRNASLVNTMVHSWGPQVAVRPHSGTIIEAGGRFESNYVSLRSAGDIISNPTTWLKGDGASAKYNTIILGDENSVISTGGDIHMEGRDTRAEIIHRGVCIGGKINQEGLIIGLNDCKAHVDCSGMLVNPGKDGYIQANPGLKAVHANAQMSHEASIGKIAPEQVEYLQSRGIDEQEAISMIIRGFLDTGIGGLGSELDERIAEIAKLASQGEG